MTEYTNDIVVGTIVSYDPSKRFGFAEATIQDGSRRVERVFFHQSDCRKVVGTPEDAVLTRQPDNRQATYCRGYRRDPEQILMRVVPSTKGPRAAYWGFRPKRTWLEDLAFYNSLNGYKDGEVFIKYTNERARGRILRKVEGRLIAEPLLMPGDPWGLTLEYDVYDGAGRSSPPTQRGTTVFWLDHSYPYRRLPYGRYAMDVEVGPRHGSEEWAHIVFFPPES